jgi:hypothetical protein
LLHFLHGLGTSGADADRLANVTINISCGDPQRNKNYRAAVFGNKKSDPIEAQAAARFAVSERPTHTPPLPAELRTPRQVPAPQVVTAAWKDTVADSHPVGDRTYIDFAHLKRQLSMAQVLDHLGLTQRLRGSGSQRRFACPIHRGDGRGRTFSVNFDDNVFQCFDAACGKKGDVIDLWVSVKAMSVRQAAIDLVNTFHLEPSPRTGTEKRKG